MSGSKVRRDPALENVRYRVPVETSGCLSEFLDGEVAQYPLGLDEIDPEAPEPLPARGPRPRLGARSELKLSPALLVQPPRNPGCHPQGTTIHFAQRSFGPRSRLVASLI